MVACNDCFFKGLCIGAKGDITSPFVVVGESPGAMELAKGIPFMGPAGDLVHNVLNLPENALPFEPYITSAFNCMPRQKDPSRLAQACRACNSRLLEEIQAHPRKVILVLGNAALWSLTGNYGLKITQQRGKVFPSPLAEHGIVACVHPSFLLHGGGSLQQFKRDIRMAIKLVTGDESEEEDDDYDEQEQAEARRATIKAVGKFAAPNYVVLETPEEVKELADLLKTQKYIAGDFETDGFDPRQRIYNPPSYMGEGILSIGISFQKNFAYVVPGKLITNDLFDNDAEWIWQNGKFDLGWGREYGYKDIRVNHDTMMLSYSLNEQSGMHDLEQIGADWLQAPNYKDMLDQHVPSRKHSYAFIPKPVLYKYQAIDACLTYCLLDPLLSRVMADKHLSKSYTQVIIPAIEFIHEIERNGFMCDAEEIAKNEERLLGICKTHEDEFIKMYQVIVTSDKYQVQCMDTYGETVPETINMRSPQQLQKFLYGILKLGPASWGTGIKILDRLPKHPVVDVLKAYRKVQKQVSTFVTPIRLKAGTDGRMRTTFKLHGTTTGRLSSNKPNMQNIPRDPLIRGQFIAPPGRCLLEVDLSQAELRVLACLSQDIAMIDIFLSGKSLHDEVAEYLFGKGFGKEQKMIAKNINFGIIYGITAKGLFDQVQLGAKRQGSDLEVTMEAAQQWINGWYERFPQAHEFIEKCRDAPLKGQSLISVFGRKRRFNVVTRERLHGMQNEAANFPEQTTASDITLTSGTRIYKELKRDHDSLVVNTVHDCLVNDLPDRMETVAAVARKIMSTMESIPREWGLTEVPFKAEAEIGYRWGNCKGFDPYANDWTPDMTVKQYLEYLNAY